MLLIDTNNCKSKSNDNDVLKMKSKRKYIENVVCIIAVSQPVINNAADNGVFLRISWEDSFVISSWFNGHLVLKLRFSYLPTWSKDEDSRSNFLLFTFHHVQRMKIIAIHHDQFRERKNQEMIIVITKFPLFFSQFPSHGNGFLSIIANKSRMIM